MEQPTPTNIETCEAALLLARQAKDNVRNRIFDTLTNPSTPMQEKKRQYSGLLEEVSACDCQVAKAMMDLNDAQCKARVNVVLVEMREQMAKLLEYLHKEG